MENRKKKMISKYIIMAGIFGRKTKKYTRFGAKVAKAGIFGLKTGGKLAFATGTMMGNPQLMAAGSGAMGVGQGIEKLTR
jgi:hypothetical protein